MSLVITSGGGKVQELSTRLSDFSRMETWELSEGKLEQMTSVQVELHENQNLNRNLGVVQLTVNWNWSNTSSCAIKINV